MNLDEDRHGTPVVLERMPPRPHPRPSVRRRRPGPQPRRVPLRAHRAMRRATLGLTGAIVVAGAVVVGRPAGLARITVLDVGQGDAILVEGSRGGRLLIDGGPDPARLMVVLDSRIPPWDRRIDAVILSHPHEDHVAGLARLLARYRRRAGVRAGHDRTGAGVRRVAAPACRTRGAHPPRTRRGRLADGRRHRDACPLAGARARPPAAARRRHGHQQRVRRAARRRGPVSIPAGRRRRGGHRSVAARRGASAAGPAQGGASRQPDGDDAALRGRRAAAGRDRLGRDRESVRASRAVDPQATRRRGGPRVPDGPRRDGGRHLRRRRHGGRRVRWSGCGVGHGPCRGIGGQPRRGPDQPGRGLPMRDPGDGPRARTRAVAGAGRAAGRAPGRVADRRLPSGR